MKRLELLSNNALKIIACIFMTIDHVGMIFFPQIEVFRILGRIAFPLFAFMIAEGCKYTKNKAMHFGMIFSVGVVMQIVYCIATQDYLMSIFLTFSLSILMIYSMQFMKKTVFDYNAKIDQKIISIILFLSVVFACFFLTNLNMFVKFGKITFDYGFYGALFPVLVSLFDFSFLEKAKENKFLVFLDGKWGRLILSALGCLLLSLMDSFVLIEMNLEWFSFLSLVFLFFYNGQRGKLNLKYMFYIYYPVHILVIEMIAMIISNGQIIF